MYKTISKKVQPLIWYNYYESNNMTRKYLNGGATEADGRASAPVGPSLAMPLPTSSDLKYVAILRNVYVSKRGQGDKVGGIDMDMR